MSEEPLASNSLGHEHVILGLPLPPSVNHQYWYQIIRRFDPATKKWKQHAKPTPTQELKGFYASCEKWAWTHRLNYLTIKRWLEECMKNHEAIRVDCYFLMQASSIVTKDGRPKRNDTKNRVKAVHDGLTKAFGVDDSWFWAGYDDKVPVRTKEEEGVVVAFGRHMPFKWEELYKLLGLQPGT